MLKFFLIIFCFLINQFDSLATNNNNFFTTKQLIIDQQIILISKNLIFDDSNKITSSPYLKLKNDFDWNNSSNLASNNKYFIDENYDVSYFYKLNYLENTKICDEKSNFCFCYSGQQKISLGESKIIKNSNFKKIKFYNTNDVLCDGNEAVEQNSFLLKDINNKFISISNKSKEWEQISKEKINKNIAEENYLIAINIENTEYVYNFNDPKQICKNSKEFYDKENDMVLVDCNNQ